MRIVHADVALAMMSNGHDRRMLAPFVSGGMEEEGGGMERRGGSKTKRWRWR